MLASAQRRPKIWCARHQGTHCTETREHLHNVLLLVLDQAAAGAVDHALGGARGARRVHDEQRVVKGELLKVEVRHVVAIVALLHEIVPHLRHGRDVGQVELVRLDKRQHHHLLYALEACLVARGAHAGEVSTGWFGLGSDVYYSNVSCMF